MKASRKKTLSVVLCFTIVLSMLLPMSALLAETEVTPCNYAEGKLAPLSESFLPTDAALTATVPVSFARELHPVTAIAITAQPNNLTYIEGQTLDLTGLVVTLTFANGDTRAVSVDDFATNGLTVNPARGTVLTVANHHDSIITVIHTESGLSSTTFPLRLTVHTELVGTAIIDNMNPRVGDVLTGTFVGSLDPDALWFDWYSDGRYAGFGRQFSVRVQDLGNTITLRVAYAGQRVISSPTSEVQKRLTPTPPAPVALLISHDFVILSSFLDVSSPAGTLEFSIDNGETWQHSIVFDGLTPNTQYSFIQRIAQTFFSEASDPSPALTVMTLPPPTARLATLEITPGTLLPEFNPDVFMYSVYIGVAPSVTVAATAPTGYTVVYGNGLHMLDNSDINVIAVIVACDTTPANRNNYLIVASRQLTPPLPPSPVLDTLAVSPGTLSPSFDPNVSLYSMHLVTPPSLSFDATPTVTVTATAPAGYTVVSGDGQHKIHVGMNVIEIVVASNTNPEITRKYTLVVTRELDPVPSLATLTFTPGALTPPLTAGVFEYKVNVGRSQTVNIAATPLPGFIFISGYRTVFPGEHALEVGKNIFRIAVAYGTDPTVVSYYDITVIREAPAVNGSGGGGGAVGGVPSVATTGVTIVGANTREMTVNGTLTLTANVQPANATNSNVRWTSSNPNVATVNANGVVTAVAEGTATITATTVAGNHTAQVVITVNDDDEEFTPTPPPLCDSISDWAIEQVKEAIEAGLVPELLQSDFTQTMTRAEFTALTVALYETVTGREITGRRTFIDTDDVNVQKAAYIGVTIGVGGNRFAPNAELTREQAAVMLARLAYILKQPLPEQSPTFADNAYISFWAFDDVGRVQAGGIMEGVGNNIFAPQNPYTREHSIATMLRLFESIAE